MIALKQSMIKKYRVSLAVFSMTFKVMHDKSEVMILYAPIDFFTTTSAMKQSLNSLLL